MSRRNRAKLAQIVPVSRLPERESDAIPVSAEVATFRKAEFLDPVQIREFPNFSTIITYRANGEGIRFYDTMLGTDADLAGYFQDLYDDVLQYPAAIRAASDSLEHLLHARFIKFALGEVPHFRNVTRHMLDSYARGFSVAEKIYGVVTRGEWAGAIYYPDIIDKPQRWFNFGLDRRLYLRTPAGDLPGQLLPQEKFVVVTFGSNNVPWGAPMLDLTYYPWFLKHHALKNQAISSEKWAQPTPMAEYEPSNNMTTNQANIEKALAMAMAVQSDQAIAVPRGMVLKLLESARNGHYQYEAYISQLTRMESALITGQILTTSGNEGGSYALGEVHERKEKNRVKMLARFVAGQITRQLIRDLIDRNFGPQDAYPRYEIMALSAGERQAEATLEAAQQKVGHRLSRSWSASRAMIVEPQDGGDALEPPVELLNQPSGAAGNLAAPPTKAKTTLLAAPPRGLLEKVRAHASKTQKKLEAIGSEAAKGARGAFEKIVKSIASNLRGRKKLSRIDRSLLIKSLRNAPLGDLGRIYDRMLLRPEKVKATGLAEPGGPPDVSTSAKLALSLSLLGVVDRFDGALEDARAMDQTPEQLADDVLDENGSDIPGHFSNIFEAVHETNIVSVHAARLQQQLRDPEPA